MIPVLLLLLAVQPADAGRRSREAAAAEVPQRPYVAPRPEVPPDNPPGSLWDEVAVRRLMGMDGEGRQLGDLVTVIIDESTVTSLDADTLTEDVRSTNAAVQALLGAENVLTNAVPALGGKLAIEATKSSRYDGGGSTSRGSTTRSTITAEILDVSRAGILRIWGYKQIRVNRELQYVVIDAWVRPRDITAGNTVSSDRLAEMSLDIVGRGVVADKQGPGVLGRVLDAIWPF